MVRAEIQHWRQATWDEKMVNLDTKDGSRWRFTRSILRGGGIRIPPLQVNDAKAYSVEEKAEALLRQFISVHTEADSRENKSFSEQVKSSVTKYLFPKEKASREVGKNPSLNKIKPTTPKESLTLLRRLKSNKAPSHDGIQNIVLKNLPRKAIVTLANIVNAVFRLSYFLSE